MRLLRKGAEAHLFLGEVEGVRVVVKRRVKKPYRIPALDAQIRAQRTLREVQLLREAKGCGVPAPTVLSARRGVWEIVMGFVEGVRLREHLEEASAEERGELCWEVGGLVGRLHVGGLIHGDLTTSNMILSPDGRVFLVDFGLGFHSGEVEDQGVDLHLLRRALQSAHYKYAEECFNEVIRGYVGVVGEGKGSEILRKVEEVERRGRYFAERMGR